MINATPTTPAPTFAPKPTSMVTPPPTTPGSAKEPMMAKPVVKRKFNWKMVLGIVVVLFLVSAGGVGLYLSQQSQEIRQQAAGCTGASNCSTSCKNGSSFSDACPANGAFSSCDQWAQQACATVGSTPGSSGGTTPASTPPQSTDTCKNGYIYCGGCINANRCASQTCNKWIDQECKQAGCGGEGTAPAAGQSCCTGLRLCANGRCGQSCPLDQNPICAGTREGSNCNNGGVWKCDKADPNGSGHCEGGAWSTSCNTPLGTLNNGDFKVGTCGGDGCTKYQKPKYVCSNGSASKQCLDDPNCGANKCYVKSDKCVSSSAQNCEASDSYATYDACLTAIGTAKCYVTSDKCASYNIQNCEASDSYTSKDACTKAIPAQKCYVTSDNCTSYSVQNCEASDSFLKLGDCTGTSTAECSSLSETACKSSARCLFWSNKCINRCPPPSTIAGQGCQCTNTTTGSKVSFSQGNDLPAACSSSALSCSQISYETACKANDKCLFWSGKCKDKCPAPSTIAGMGCQCTNTTTGSKVSFSQGNDLPPACQAVTSCSQITTEAACKANDKCLFWSGKCKDKCPAPSTIAGMGCQCTNTTTGSKVSFSQGNDLPPACQATTQCQAVGQCVASKADCCSGTSVADPTNCTTTKPTKCVAAGTGDTGDTGADSGTGTCNTGLPYGKYAVRALGNYTIQLATFFQNVDMFGFKCNDSEWGGNRCLANQFYSGTATGGQTIDLKPLMNDPNKCWYQFDFNYAGLPPYQGNPAAVTICYCPTITNPPTPPPTNPPPAVFQCNTPCNTDAECKGADSRFVCHTVSEGNKRCRLADNLSSDRCQPAAPQCLSIKLNNVSNPNAGTADPKLGENITLTCGEVTGAQKYIFLITEPDGELATPSATGRVSAQYTITKPGKHYAQCQICTGANNSSCLPFEPRK